MLPENGKLFRYDRLAINVIVENSKGGINSCDIPFNDDLQQFNRDYMELTTKVAEKTAPAQRLTCSTETPSSWVKYIGRKGISIV